MTTRVRFAPSPTGYLHLGSARTALFNYLFAKQTGGKFLLRVEDTDTERSTAVSTVSIIQGLEWLGFTPDEPVVYQSHNADKHRQTANHLLKDGKAYRDFGGGKADRDLSKSDSDNRAKTEPFAIRLRIPDVGNSSFDDLVYGLNERNYADIEDLVLIKTDGQPLYNLAVVCDDIEMKITHVIRGQDHLTNTHKQLLIYKALGKTPPIFAHLPLINAPDKKKLSKRFHGEIVAVSTYEENGFLPSAFLNFLALLGWSSKTETEIMTLEELIKAFSFDGIHRNSAIFNFDANNPKRWTDDKAIWMNAEYIRKMPLKDLLKYVLPDLYNRSMVSIISNIKGDDIYLTHTGLQQADIFRIIDVIRQRFFYLSDFYTQGRAYFCDDFELDTEAVRKNLSDVNLKSQILGLADILETVDNFTEENIQPIIRKYAEDNKYDLRALLNAARTLITGQAVGASMFVIFELIGKNRCIKRLRTI